MLISKLSCKEAEKYFSWSISFCIINDKLYILSLAELLPRTLQQYMCTVAAIATVESFMPFQHPIYVHVLYIKVDTAW